MNVALLQVFRYVLLITKIVIPKQLWGNKRNFNLVQRCQLHSFEFYVAHHANKTHRFRLYHRCQRIH